jgi:hypothetical protein
MATYDIIERKVGYNFLLKLGINFINCLVLTRNCPVMNIVSGRNETCPSVVLEFRIRRYVLWLSIPFYLLRHTDFGVNFISCVDLEEYILILATK